MKYSIHKSDVSQLLREGRLYEKVNLLVFLCSLAPLYIITLALSYFPLLYPTLATAVQVIAWIKVAIEHFSHIRHRYFAIAIDIPAHPDIGQAVIGFIVNISVRINCSYTELISYPLRFSASSLFQVKVR